MADPNTPVPTPALVAEPITPVSVPAPTAVVDPVQPVSPALVPTPAPVVETPPAPVPEAVVTPPAPEPAKPAAAQTVIGAELDKKPVEAPVVAPEIKPAETPVVEAKVTEGGQSDEPAPPPKYEPFKLPEGMTLEEQKVSDFTNILADLEVKGKVPHEMSQEFGQKLVDFHINEVKTAVEGIQKQYSDAWENQKVTWKDEFLKDPEIGGNRWQTTVDSALTFIRTHGGTPEQQTEFRNLMESSGLGNNPAMIRLLANAGRAMSEGRPLAATRPVTPPKSKTSTLYGKS